MLKKFGKLGLAISLFALLGNPAPAESFDMPGLPGMGGDKKEEKKSGTQDVEGVMSGVLKDLSSAKEIERRGRRMLAKAYDASNTANTLLIGADAALEVVKNTTAIIASGGKKVNTMARDLDTKWGVAVILHKEESKKLRGYAAATGKVERDTAKGGGTESFQTGSPEFSQKSYDSLKVDSQKAVSKFHDEGYLKVVMASKAAKQAFITDLVFPTTENLAYSREFVESTTELFPIIIKRLDEIDKEASKAGQEIVKQGVITVASLVLQQKKISGLISDLKSDPLGNAGNIKKLKDVLDQVMFFMNTLRSHNENIEKVNGVLAGFIGTIKSSESSFKEIGIMAGDVLAALDDAIAVVLKS
jgi:hypothetical protein